MNEQCHDFNNFYEVYQAKLKRFNQTDKYLNELIHLKAVMDATKDQKVLDYGCGTGFAVEWFRRQGYDVYGYDFFRYVEGNPDWYRKRFNFKFHHIYFMHSFAHIPEIETVLTNLKQSLHNGAFITVLTPNRMYLDAIVNDSYIPDPTVVKHYTALELIDVFDEVGFKLVEVKYIGDEVDEYFERILIKFQLK